MACDPRVRPHPTRLLRRARWIRFGAAGLVCMMLGACTNPVDSPRARAGTCQVGVVGDSLTVGAQSQGSLEPQLAAAGCTVTAVDAVIGRSTSAGADVVEVWADAGTLPAILIVELGTNDCSASAFEASARRILAAAGGDRPVVWVTTWRTGCDDQINAVIHRLQVEDQATGGNRIWVLDHHAWIAEHPELLAGDGIHLTADGYAADAARMAASVGSPSPFEVGLDRAGQAITSLVDQLL